MKEIKAVLNKIERKAPLIHCMTNYVTVNDVANAIASLGASPVMAHHKEEVRDITGTADCLLLNMGATEYIEEMLISAHVCEEKRIPIVLDPVGVGSSGFRRKIVSELMKKSEIFCIRGNISEIKALAMNVNTSKGVDASLSDRLNADNFMETIEILKDYSVKTDSVVMTSGKVDIITDGHTVYKVEGGSAFMKRISGSGCISTAVLSAFLSVDRSIASVLCSSYMVRACARKAELSMGNCGTATFKIKLLDCLSLFNKEDISYDDEIKITRLVY